METLKFGYDDNLGLPADFAEKVGCEIVAYHELDELIRAFTNGDLDAIFTPAGSLPYLQHYEIAAQATLGVDKKQMMKSTLVSTQTITTNDIPTLTLGAINPYCTSSYWAPMIYLMNHLPAGTTLTFKFADSFTDLLHQTAQNKIDCAMVWDDILQLKPDDAKQVQEYFSLDDLPTPVIVVRPGVMLPGSMINYVSSDKEFLFAGFKAPGLENINNFLQVVNAARKHFVCGW